MVSQNLVKIVLIEDGLFSYSNLRCDDVFGYSGMELRERNPLQLTVRDDRELAAENLARRLSGEIDHADFVFRGLGMTRAAVWLDYSSALLLGSSISVCSGSIAAGGRSQYWVSTARS